ncbi:DNA cytosine methyltransferase [Candidatus Methylospira mobilis]|uniref:DNA cytosine methyltransferase n=1 Tax=Candidatus Methylospira mobilis TaxID=1808979 RepID=UPI0028EAEB5E|nr:DNA cytosine methyltransferase [Candidatus Methylospira mobilis]WNV05821.1 DNA cytosine methyltransferase [Candidatus Methylospira mobilis]
MRQQHLDFQSELVIDLFAGGGGTSTGIEMAIGVPPHIAVNHNPDALSMHQANHPFTRHYMADVYEVCPIQVAEGRPVGGLHLSPDCRHHSQAAGGQPRDSKIRSLSWVALRWAGQVKPRIIALENVRQIQKWGPLIAKRKNGRVIKLDGTVAAPGERVPVQQQHLIPDPKRAGKTWRRFISLLEHTGYTVDSKMLCAADYGTPTTRERLFMVARCDGQPIVWPKPTHFKNPKKGQKKWRAAAECIDWSISGKSIFDRKTPLKPNTLRRIAKGITRLVLNNPNPFIVNVTHIADRADDIEQPLRVECVLSEQEEAGALRVASFLMQYYSEGGQWGDLNDPMNTITTRDRLALVTVMIEGAPYVIVDILLRMLQPHELYKAQGFPDDYIIDRGHDGRLFTKSKQVYMCGNSVPPPLAAALFEANLPDLSIRKRRFVCRGL